MVFHDQVDAYPAQNRQRVRSCGVKAAVDAMALHRVLAQRAVEKSADMTTKWTQAALAKTAQLAKTPDHPDNYAHAMTDFGFHLADDRDGGGLCHQLLRDRKADTAGNNQNHAYDSRGSCGERVRKGKRGCSYTRAAPCRCSKETTHHLRQL